MEVLLKTFISETIKEIIDGVIEAQKHVVAVKEEDGTFLIGENKYQEVEFDISVTTSQSTEKGKKAGLMIKVIDLGVQDSNTIHDSAVNRIKFKVPVIFRPKGNEKPKPKIKNPIRKGDSIWKNRY